MIKKEMNIANKRGFSISIPQLVIGFVAMFVAILGIRIFNPIIFTFIDTLTWKSAITLLAVKIVIWLVIFMIIYVIMYGTIMGKKPDILNLNNGGTQ